MTEFNTPRSLYYDWSDSCFYNIEDHLIKQSFKEPLKVNAPNSTFYLRNGKLCRFDGPAVVLKYTGVSIHEVYYLAGIIVPAHLFTKVSTKLTQTLFK